MWMPGDWMSVSITPTRFPRAERTAAIFAVVFDLPVPPRKEWIETIAAISQSYRRSLRAHEAAPTRDVRSIAQTLTETRPACNQPCSQLAVASLLVVFERDELSSR